MAELIYISISKLGQHPDNPRKDLGDLTELADSIRVNGVLQNLTVVPKYGEISGEPTGCYRVIIGHRRLAAAKLAGLTELPCVVADMTPKEQLHTMLTENMQRSDLTVYEQAQGFQMMLDLGETVESIARDSGFSQSTIRRRVRLLELDKDKFKKAESRGATLQDYMELDKINDPELKNRVLDSIGTPNFRNKLQQAIEQEKRIAFMESAEKFAAEFAEEIADVDYKEYTYVRNYGWWNRSNLERPADADTVKYFYKVRSHQIDLYRKKTDEATVNEEEIQKQLRKAEYERRRNGIREATNRAYKLRYQFVQEYTQAKSHADLILKWLSVAAMYNDTPDHELLSQLLQIEYDDDADEILQCDYIAAYDTRPEYVRLCTAYAALEKTYYNGNHLSYFECRWTSENGYMVIYEKSEELDNLYTFLGLLGYELSDEEKCLTNGTHELFEKAPAND